MSSVFDPTNILLNTETTEQFTRAPALPIGQYQAVTGAEFKVEEREGKNGTFYILKFPVYIDGASPTPDGKTVKEITGMDRFTIRADGFVDLLEDKSGWDFGVGKNGFLRKLREVLGQDTPGNPWKLSMLAGQGIKVLVGQRPDKNDPTVQYNEISGYVK